MKWGSVRWNRITGLGLFLCILLSLPALAQVDLKTLRKEGDRLFDVGNYWSALPNYEQYHQANPTDFEVKYRLAITYYHTNQVPKALQLLEFLQQIPKFSNAELPYYLGLCYHNTNNFKDAIHYYKEFLREIPEGHDQRLMIKSEIRRCANGLRLAGGTNTSVLVENMGEKINSRGDDFRPVQSPTNNMRLYFSSAREGTLGGKRNNNGEQDPINGTFSSDMYFSSEESGIWSEAVTMTYLLNSPKWDVVLDFSETGSMMYYYKGLDLFNGQMYVDTFRTKLEERSLFSTPFESSMRPELGDQEPYFYNDTILLFSSARGGGYGGLDLYITTFSQGQWSEPENLGPKINSEFDETTPFLAEDGRTLFFSSNDSKKSIGGLDIFKATFVDEEQAWTEPENLGMPVNSAQNDMHFRLTADGLRGFFASDRKTGLGARDLYTIYFKNVQRENRNRSIPLVFSDVTAYKGVYSKTGGTTTRPSEKFGGRPIMEYYLEPLYYEEDGSVLSPRNVKNINAVGEILLNFPQIRLVLTSHSDGTDPRRFDLFFSIKRAEQISEYLLQTGIPIHNIYLKAVGDAYPVANNIIDGQEEPLGRRMNRRIDLEFLDTEGQPVVVHLREPTIEGPLSNPAWEYYQNAIKGLSYKIQVAESKQMYNNDLLLRYPNTMIEKTADSDTYLYTVGLYQTYKSASQFQREMEGKGMEVLIVPYINGQRIPSSELPAYYSLYPDLENFANQ